MKSWNFVIFVRKCNVLKLPKDQKAFKVSGSHYLESSFLVKMSILKLSDLDIKISVTYKLTQTVTNLVYEAYSIYILFIIQGDFEPSPNKFEQVTDAN